MEGGRLFIELLFPDSTELEKYYIKDGEPHVVEDEVVIWIRLNTYNDRSGFDFYVTEFVSCGADVGDRGLGVYFTEGFECECLFWGNVKFDGLRHLYMGDEQTYNENYLYCVSTETLAKVFAKLRELETVYCTDS